MAQNTGQQVRESITNTLESILQQESEDLLCLTQNRFSVLSDIQNQNGEPGNSGNPGEASNVQDGQWKTVMGKRRRGERGSIDLETFESMDVNCKLNVLFEKLNNVEISQDTLRGIKENLAGADRRVDRLESNVLSNSDTIRQLSYKVLDLETQSREKNMLIYGLNEEAFEDIQKTVFDFIYNYLDLELDDLYLDSCKRLGRKPDRVRGSLQNDIPKKRPVLIKFMYAEDVTTCIDKAYKLAGTQFSIDRDYPSEIRQARKRLWPEVKRLRAREGKKSVKLVFPAAIKVNGAIVKDEFPGWDSTIKSDLKLLNDQNTQRAQLITHDFGGQQVSTTASVRTQLRRNRLSLMLVKQMNQRFWLRIAHRIQVTKHNR